VSTFFGDLFVGEGMVLCGLVSEIMAHEKPLAQGGRG